MARRVEFVTNPNYQRSGTKSYVHLMRKYRLRTTKDGPYSFGHVIRQTGRPFSDKPVGGRIRFQPTIRKYLPDGQMEQAGVDDIEQDAPYFLPVQIGTPAQTVHLVIDTASPDLWVRSPELTQTGFHHVFDPSKSSTFHKPANRGPWKIVEVDGSSLSGPIGTDNVTLGDMMIKNQEIELVNMMSSDYDRFSGDGYLGMSLHSYWSDMLGVADGIWGQKELAQSQKLFTVKVGIWGRSKPFCSFGYIDQDVVDDCNGSIHYAEVDSTRGYWTFDSTSVTVGEKVMDRPMNLAMPDTNAQLTLLDDTLCQMIYDAIPGAFYDNECQGFIFPSSVTFDQRPSIRLDIGGRHFTMPKVGLGFAEVKPGYIYGGIQSRGTGKLDILGANFLEGIYAVNSPPLMQIYRGCS
ncbi:aspartic peptidase domain-containing protein [Aspergillus ambiguus]|uniref:aspartic peptidase domain-containing protein n=1 Tax=Aspergillus ambiguus TaxID=176160 RepID=UPI003CCD4798